MNFIQAIKTVVIDKYCCFSGRARRSEFWYYLLFSTLLSIVVSTFSMGSVVNAAERYLQDNDMVAYLTAIYTSPGMIISLVLSLSLLLPSLGVYVRRLHDVGKSGWWLLGFYVLACIPIINFFVMIYFIYLCCKDSEPGENEYGPNPKGVSEFGDSSNI